MCVFNSHVVLASPPRHQHPRCFHYYMNTVNDLCVSYRVQDRNKTEIWSQHYSTMMQYNAVVQAFDYRRRSLLRAIRC